MPTQDFQSGIVNYPLAKDGVNLYVSPNEMLRTEAMTMQNLVFRNGVVKRNGYAKHTETNELTAVVASKPILGLHRFYMADGTNQILAVADTAAKYWDGSAWQNVKTGLTADKSTRISTWGALNRCYFANGTDTGFKWDGSTATDIDASYTGSDADRPTKPVQFLPYQDRLLAIDNDNKGYLLWSESYDDAAWELKSNRPRLDTRLFGMIVHADNQAGRGLESKVLIAGEHDMYLFSGTFLHTSNLIGDWQFEQLGVHVGCSAPRTMVNTPAGTLWLGNNRQVYILPYGTNSPIEVGDKIRSNDPDREGIENIPAAQIENACATYHDGYYMLACAQAGDTTNTTQFWLDIRRIQKDGQSFFYGPWFGPMKGLAVSMFARQDGPTDGGVLLAGDHASTGQIYEYNKTDQYSDDGAAIDFVYQSQYDDLGDDGFMKVVHRMEYEWLNVDTVVTASLFDFGGSLNASEMINLGEDAVYWDDFYWDDFYWSASGPVRKAVSLDPSAALRRMSVRLEGSEAEEPFEVYAIKVHRLEESLEFDD